MSPQVGRWDSRSGEEMRKKPQPSGVVTDKGQRRAAEEADRDAKKRGRRLYNCILI